MTSSETVGANRLADALLRPRSIAIIGASADPSKNNGRPQRYLAKHGYEGDVYPVNPNYASLFDKPCYPSVSAIGVPVDHAYLMVPSRAIESAVRDCVASGVKCASIFSGGFAETGPEGERQQRRIVDIAREGGLRLLGPNSLGVVNTNARIALSANAVLERDRMDPGRVGLVSQSGSLIGALVSRGQARGINFGTLVSVGNEADLSVGEIASMMLEDPDLDAVTLFLETLRHREALEEMAHVAKAKGKPIIAYVLGQSEVGRSLSQSHTGALAGNAVAMDAFLADMGIVRVDMFETLLEAPALLARRPKANGRRVAIVTTTGGGGALVADNLGARDITVVPPDDALRETLLGHKIDIGHSAIVDLTMAGTREEVVDACIGQLVSRSDIDLVVMVVGSSSEFHPHLAVKPLIKWANSGKPVAAFLCPNAAQSLTLLQEAGIAAFRTPESCADAVDAYLCWRDPRPLSGVPLPADAADLIKGDGALNEQQSLELFAKLGVRTAESTIVGLDENIPANLSYPLVAKVLSDKIAHKSDIGGVVIGIRAPEELAEARKRILANVEHHFPGLEVEGILAQTMHKGLGEAIVGFHEDPLAGPVVMVGMGGIFAEVYRDVSVRLAPVDMPVARQMISEVKGFAGLRGARGQQPGDLEALAAVVVAVSNLASRSGRTVASAEINPVMVCAEGCVAVDGLVHLSAEGQKHD